MTRYTALIDGEAGAYGVVVPDIPGCHAMGATVEEALANAAEALRELVAFTEADGAPVPPPRPVEALRADPEVRSALADGAVLGSVPLVRETGKWVRANVSLDTGMLAAIDAEARRRGITRSAMIEVLARHALPELG